MMEKPKADHKYTLLTSWASVATAVLLVVLIGGAVYISDLKSRNNCSVSVTLSRVAV